MIILGIDPGTATTGYGLIKVKNRRAKIKNNLICLSYGLIETSPSLTAPDRLKKINNELSKIISKYQPEIMAVESIFFFKNLKTAIPVSQAKGVILLTAAKKKIPVEEFSPPQVKSIVTKNGWASKAEVQKKVKENLRLKEIPKPDDAADALGIAICSAVKCSQQKRTKKT